MCIFLNYGKSTLKENSTVKNVFSITAMALSLAVSIPQLALADGGHTLFIKSAVENANGTVTFPLYKGTSHGQTVYYVLMDASDGNFAQQYGINTAQKLVNAANTAAVQKTRP